MKLRLTLIVCAFALLAAPAATAHTMTKPHPTLEATLAMQRQVVRHDRQVIRFFRTHRWMLARYNVLRPIASRELRWHRAQLRWTLREIAETKTRIAAREARKLADPWEAIRAVFGSYADQANAVASCESGHSVWAANGQYLGLFQMGSSERAIYGHGSTPLEQARAAHRYFVASGSDWSPWQCKPW
jgi:hypothetical protein